MNRLSRSGARHRAALRSVRWIAPIALALASFLAAAQSPAQPATSSADIHAVIQADDLETVRKAIASGADVDARDPWGRTPLIVALQRGKAGTVDLLVNAGARVSLTDAWGRSPLLVATQFRNTAAVRLLLARGVDVNQANKNDITPLMAAAQTGNLEAMGMLLEAGAAVDHVDNLGWSALMWAAGRNDAAAVRMLLDKGANVDATGRDGATAHSLALARGADPTLLALLPASSPTGPRSSGHATPAARATPPGITVPKGPVLRPVVEPDRIIRGLPDAPITIVEYTDFQCPYCAASSRTLEELMVRYGGQLRLVLKHQPLPFHPMARPAAEIFEALALQDPDRAWAFHDRIFSGQAALAGGEAYLRKQAGDLGGDMPRLERDRAGPVVRARLAGDLREAQRFQFDGVPAYVINGRVIEGAQPMQAFVDLIEALLRQ